MVHDIIPEKSTALQSAAKVPLLVTFLVSDRQRLPHRVELATSEREIVEAASIEASIEASQVNADEDEAKEAKEANGRRQGRRRR